MINELNWTHCQYESSDYSTKISIGGEMDRNNQYLETYFVNRFHGEQLLFQKKLTSLKEACEHINSTFGHWTFKDLENNESNSGCSSCQAH
jgi:hypothetical protein